MITHTTKTKKQARHLVRATKKHTKEQVMNIAIDGNIIIIAYMSMILFFSSFFISFAYKNYNFALWMITIILFALIIGAVMSIEDHQIVTKSQYKILNIIILLSIVIISSMVWVSYFEFGM